MDVKPIFHKVEEKDKEMDQKEEKVRKAEDRPIQKGQCLSHKTFPESLQFLFSIFPATGWYPL